jgi:acyl carrier protein
MVICTVADVERNEIATSVAKSLAEVLERDLPGLTEDVRLFEDLNMDSTSVLELLMTLEDNVGVEIDAEDLDMDNFKTVGTLTDYLLSIPTLTSRA